MDDLISLSTRLLLTFAAGPFTCWYSDCTVRLVNLKREVS